MKEIYLYQLNKELRLFLSSILILLTIAVIVGLIYLYYTTSFSKSETTERLAESTELIEEDFGIDESSVRSDTELLTTTHNHLFGFAFLFFITGIIFYFNSTIKGFWKIFLMIEPVFSAIISFGSMWLVRYLGESYIYITMISAVLMYTSFFIIISICLFELLVKPRVLHY